MAKSKPAVGSRAWERSLHNNPSFAKEAIQSLTARASAGEPGAADLLDRWLADFPEYRAQIRALDDLTAKAEAAWVKLVGGGNPLAERAARDDAAALKVELLPPGAGVLDRVLAGAVVVAHLAHAHAARAAAAGDAVPGVQAARDRRLSEAQKRLVAAFKGWRTVAARKPTGLGPRLKVVGCGGRGASS